MTNEDANTVPLGKQLDISMAGVLYQQLSRALDTEETLVLDGSGTERVDTASIQLLMAFRRQAELQGRDWEWINRPACLEEAETRLGTTSA